jgi:APA family basic amino acid/polyamine antiporter
MGLFSRKPIDTFQEEAFGGTGPRLRRTLSTLQLVAFGVGCTVGAGIFSLTGEVAATTAGPAVSLAFLFASVACFFAGLCYAEFAAMVPVSGSAYSYAYATLGEIVAWIIGWSLITEWLFSVSVVAISWSGYTTAALKDLGIILPAVLAQAPLKVENGHAVATGAWIDLPAVAVVLVCTALALTRTRTSAWVTTVLVAIKILALICLVAVGIAYVNPANWHPFVPDNTGAFGSFGWSGVARGAGVLFFAFIGFDGVSTLAEDARDPQKTVPRSLFITLVLVTILYVAVSIVVTGLAGYKSLAVPDPLYFALSAGGSSAAPIKIVKVLVAVVAIIGLISVVLANILGQVRVFYSMGRDRLLPPAFCQLRGAAQVPAVATVVTGLGAAALAGVFPLGLLGELVSIGTLLAFMMVCVGVLILRRIAPGARRPFRTPWVPFVPLMGVLCCGVMMFSLPSDTWIRLGVWTGLGLIVYFAYGRRHSKLRTIRSVQSTPSDSTEVTHGVPCETPGCPARSTPPGGST